MNGTSKISQEVHMWKIIAAAGVAALLSLSSTGCHLGIGIGGGGGGGHHHGHRGGC